MNWIALFFTILGASSVLAWLYDYGARRLGARRLLRLSPEPTIDIVCTTALVARSYYGSSAARRALTPEGEIQGLAAAANTIGKFYKRSQIQLHLSDRATSAFTNDLILIGSNFGNRASEEVLGWPHVSGQVSIDATTSAMTVGSFQIAGFEHGFKGGRPTRDLGLILICPNEWAGQRKRVLLFAGLTTYATGAAATYFFEELANHRRPFNSDVRVALRAPGPFVMVVNTSFADGHLSGCSLAHWERLA